MSDNFPFHRRTIRLPDYDYSQPGMYFVTLCAQEREAIFGHICDGVMNVNDIGAMITNWYFEIAHKYANYRCDEFVIMPDHMHFIVEIREFVGADLCVRPKNPDKTNEFCICDKHKGAFATIQGAHTGAPLPEMVQWFKTMTTNAYINNVKHNGWRPFVGKLWQRNYYEHIIQGDAELYFVREYIRNNPMHSLGQIVPL